MSAVRRGKETTSLLVLESVADASDTDPCELPPLYETIDPERLDHFVTGADDDPNRRIEFTYAGYHVTVTGPDDVTVSSAD